MSLVNILSIAWHEQTYKMKEIKSVDLCEAINAQYVRLAHTHTQTGHYRKFFNSVLWTFFFIENIHDFTVGIILIHLNHFDLSSNLCFDPIYDMIWAFRVEMERCQTNWN